ncbi:MAG: nickel insertion protein [Methanobacteriota archaeon]
MLYLDCSHGIAGDMFVGSLIDLGASFENIHEKLSHIASLKAEKVDKAGVSATRFIVDFPMDQAEYTELVGTVKSIGLSENSESTALSILEKLAEAESRAHGVSLDEVHLHEAADSMVDAAASALALEDLGLLDAGIITSPVSLGFTAPATQEIISKYSIPSKKISDKEITTPTGAAIVAAISEGFQEEFPSGGNEGFGAGEMDLPYPNVFRAIVC